jgi:hypothetical protein
MLQAQQPLAVAVEAGNLSMLKLLLDAGASLGTVDTDVCSMLSFGSFGRGFILWVILLRCVCGRRESLW